MIKSTPTFPYDLPAYAWITHNGIMYQVAGQPWSTGYETIAVPVYDDQHPILYFEAGIKIDALFDAVTA